jgi:hypothetical protein
VIRVLALAGLWASLSALQVPVWRDNVTVWRQAVVHSPTLARPALNLAVAYRKRGDVDQALLWLTGAWRLAPTSPRGGEILTVIRYELAWLSSFGVPVCSHPFAPPVC